MSIDTQTEALLSTPSDVPLPDLRAPRYPRLLRKGFSSLLFRLHVKPRIERTDRVVLEGLSLSIPPTVFHPRFYYTSRFLAHFVKQMDLANRSVLEVGCGSGFVSLVAASRGGLITAVDINEAAVTATKDNAKLNGFQIRVLHSDLFEHLQGERFDHIVINPPFYDGDPSHIAEHAWKAGEKNSLIHRFAASATRFLAPGGSIIAVLSTDTEMSQVLRIFKENGFSMSCLASKRKLFETLFIFQFIPITTVAPEHER